MLQRTLLRSRITARSGLLRTAGAAARSYASPATHIPAGSVGSIKPIASTTSAAQHLETNAPSETNRLEKTAERFWEKVTVTPASDGQDGYYIQLDGKSIKTPKGLPLLIPARKKTLAHLIAHEWRILPNLKIKPHSLQLTSLAARAVDLIEDMKANEQLVKDDIVDALLPYLDTDTLLVFAPLKDCEGTLRPAQEEVYRPIIKAAEDFWAPNGLTLSWLDTEICIAGNKQTPETKQVVADWIRGLDTWQLVALERATMTAKSLISGMNIATRRMPLEDVAVAATLETIHQTQVWGEVEDTHEVDYHDLRRSLGSAYLLASDH